VLFEQQPFLLWPVLLEDGFFWHEICIKSIFAHGLATDPAGRAYDAPPEPLVRWGGGHPLPTPLHRRLRWLDLGASVVFVALSNYFFHRHCIYWLSMTSPRGPPIQRTVTFFQFHRTTFRLNWRTTTLVDMVLNLVLSHHGFWACLLVSGASACQLLFKWHQINPRFDLFIDWLTAFHFRDFFLSLHQQFNAEFLTSSHSAVSNTLFI